MSAMMPKCCVYCLRSVTTYERDVLTVVIQRYGEERIDLRWHLACADEDALHDALASALALDDGPASDEATRGAYLAIVRRARLRGGLRSTIDVRRDLADVRYTLRGPGDAWGVITPRAGRRGR